LNAAQIIAASLSLMRLHIQHLVILVYKKPP
jgi:hypothetical protein